MPTKKDRPTLGWGDTFNPDGSPIRMGQVWTRAQADSSFDTRFRRLGDKVTALLGGKPTTQGQFDALCCLADNIGLGEKGLAGSTVLRQHKAGNYAAAAIAFRSWRFQAGVELSGLIRRRAAESRMYLAGLPA